MKINQLYEEFHSTSSIQSKLIKENNFTYRIVITIINKYLKSKQNILDIGCGAGTLSMYMNNKGNKVLGIDISKNAVIIAQQSAKHLNLKNITFKTINFPYENLTEKFDFILCSEVIEHLKDDLYALKKIHKLLKPNGIAIISTPSQNAPMYKLGLADEFDKKVGHLRRYTLIELILKCEKAGFTIIETKKTEGILRNFLFLNPVAGKFIRFIKYIIVDIITYFDNISLRVFGESQLFVILTK